MAAPLVLLTLFLLDLCWCCSSSVHVTSVFQWDVMDFNWPSEEKRTKAVLDKSFKPESISPRYAAVFGNRLFLSLSKENGGNPVSLAWLPTRSTSASEPPKLNPFPYWRMHEGPNRSDTIMRATGLEVDRLGRLLWVLDVSYQNSKSKLWIFNLKENDAIHLVHQFGDIFGLNDLVLDETPDDWLAYITYYLSDNLIAFSLKTNQSWLVETQGQRFVAIAISPKNEQIYLSNHGSKELYSIGSGS
ncbi:protein yellow-like [Cloeon dipterum]|uniref:protein yellow-like n=1 Tax=Cloeon dipterum TaxID=197152 RepID=UPI00321F7035